MARIRTIKPEFWTDETLGECSPRARLLFIGTWTHADDHGNLERSARQLKVQVFPYDHFDCEPLILELISAGLLVEYESNGKKYLHISRFEKHQKIEKQSKPKHPLYDPSLRTRGGLTEGSPRSSGSSLGREGSLVCVNSERARETGTEEKNSKTKGGVDSEADRLARWQRFKAIYPQGTYPDGDFLLAEKFGEMRLDEGADFADFLAGAERFRAQQDALGRIGTQFVPSPKNFFDRRARTWLEPFPLPRINDHGSMSAGCGWTPKLGDPREDADLAAKLREDAAEKLKQSQSALVDKLRLKAGNGSGT